MSIDEKEIEKRMDTDSICYRNDFLKSVNFQLSFAENYRGPQDKIDSTLTKTILETYPIVDEQLVSAHSFDVSPTATRTSKEESISYLYFDKNRENSLRLNSNEIIFTFTKYQSFENMNDTIEKVRNAFFRIYPSALLNRLGLRYINVIKIPDFSGLLDWSEYIDRELFQIGDKFQNRGGVARAFSIYEYKYEFAHVRFQFGIPNPDYPSAIKSPEFILDIDASDTGSFDEHEILPFINNAHSYIQEIFENSITQKLRNYMAAPSR